MPKLIMRRLAILALFVLLSCYKTYEVKTKIPEFNLTLLDSLRVLNPVSAIGLDTDGGVLLLEVSGAKIIKLSSNLIVFDSIQLPQQLFYPKGISADEFFLYLYTDNGLFRFDRQKKTIKQIFTGIKLEGIAVANSNEIYLSDPQNNRILKIDANGNAKDFIKLPERFEPSRLIFDAKNGIFWVINNRSHAVESYNRIGNLKASIAVFDFDFEGIGLSSDNALFLISKNGTGIWRIDQKGDFRLYLGPRNISFVATDIVLGKERIHILDYQNRILSFKIPQ